MSDDLNPYSPPRSESASRGPAGRPRSPVLFIFATLGTIGFIVFTIVLLRSTSADRKAGMLFLINIPVLLGMTIALTQSLRSGMRLGLAAVAMQSVISIAMLVIGIGDLFLVLAINGGIILLMMLVTVSAWHLDRTDARRLGR